MAERPDDIRNLRDLAARLRTLARTAPDIAERLLQIADETDARAEAMEARRPGRLS